MMTSVQSGEPRFCRECRAKLAAGVVHLPVTVEQQVYVRTLVLFDGCIPVLASVLSEATAPRAWA